MFCCLYKLIVNSYLLYYFTLNKLLTVLPEYGVISFSPTDCTDYHRLIFHADILSMPQM